MALSQICKSYHEVHKRDFYLFQSLMYKEEISCSYLIWYFITIVESNPIISIKFEIPKLNWTKSN